MSNEQFYNRGRSDALRKLPVNPGQGTPEQHNHYMNGYNSVQSKKYSDLSGGIIEIIETHRAMQSKEGLISLLSKTLIKSLEEPADVQTETDLIFNTYLQLLEKYNDSDLKAGFAKLYNAVQKSKRFTLREGELTKYLRLSESVEKPKKKPRKN